MIDVDNFKLFNDATGTWWATGCSRAWARILTTSLRRSDVGRPLRRATEFIAVLPDTDAEAAGSSWWRGTQLTGSSPFLVDDGRSIPLIDELRRGNLPLRRPQRR
jgi:GGDEF domain-containing protein